MKSGEGRFVEAQYKKDDEFAFCNPAFQAGFDLPPQEAIARLKKRYQETANPLFMWEVVRITSSHGILDQEVNYFLIWTSSNIVEAARGTLRTPTPGSEEWLGVTAEQLRDQTRNPDLGKVLGFTNGRGETGKLKKFAEEFRNEWICHEMQRHESDGKAIKQARHLVAKQLKTLGMPLSEGTVERIARQRRT